MPRVSVIIPSYNHAKFLEKRIQSVLKQTYQDMEVICLDDASTDNSFEILRRYEDRNDFRLFRNERNSGSPFRQWELGIQLARGQYVWIAESDDFADPELLATLVSILDKNPGAGLAYCQSFYVDEDEIITGMHMEELEKLDGRLWRTDFVQNGRKMLASYMSVINVIPNASSVVFRKKVFEQAGGADKEMKLCGDWLTWSKMLLISDIAFVAQPLNYFRVHHGTVRNRVHGRQRYVQEYIDVVQFIFDKVTVGRLSKRRSAYQLKARWLRVVNENPKDITLGGIKAVFKKSHRLFGMFQAVIFFGIGFWALTNLLSINIPVIRSVKRAMRNSILRIAQP